jgi:D-3-phosphoglycerate dehydrogenase
MSEVASSSSSGTLRQCDPVTAPRLQTSTSSPIAVPIGQEVAAIGTAIGLEVLVGSRGAVTGSHWRNVPLDELLATSDIVTLHLGLNEDTRHFMNAARLAQLKRGAILVNTARGALIDEAALLEALQRGAIGHAALDVFEREPLSADSPWVDAPNVTLTAHCGYWTESATRNQVRLVLGIVSKLAR